MNEKRLFNRGAEEAPELSFRCADVMSYAGPEASSNGRQRQYHAYARQPPRREADGAKAASNEEWARIGRTAGTVADGARRCQRARPFRD
jgi:hypothetical protein